MEAESGAMALSGPSVQLGLSVTSLSSALGAKELKAGRDAVDGLNKILFLLPWKKNKQKTQANILLKGWWGLISIVHCKLKLESSY